MTDADEIQRLRAVLARHIHENTHPDCKPDMRFMVLDHEGFAHWFGRRADAERAVGLTPPVSDNLLGEDWEPQSPPPDWRLRLTFVPTLESPFVAGTGILATTVLQWIVDGCSWAEILRRKSELTREDIVAVLAWKTATVVGTAAEQWRGKGRMDW